MTKITDTVTVIVTKASIKEGTAPKEPVRVLINIGREIRKSINDFTRDITNEIREVIVPNSDLKNSISQFNPSPPFFR